MYETINKPKKSGTYSVTLYLENFDGMIALLNWLDGFEAGGHGVVPGHFELTKHLRGLNLRDKEEQNGN